MYKKIYRYMCMLSITTLIITSLMAFSVGYTVFNTEIKNELKNETNLIADSIDTVKNPVDLLSGIKYKSIEKQILLISSDGLLLFDNKKSSEKSFVNRNDINEIIKNVAGKSNSFGNSSYKSTYYFALSLSNGDILCVATPAYSFIKAFLIVFAIVIIMALLIYLLSSVISTKLTDNIISPIKNIYVSEPSSYENVYDEIKPYIQRINNQNKEIRRQMEKAKSQKSRLQTISDNMTEGLMIVGADSKMLSVNGSAVNILHIDTINLKLKSIYDLVKNDDIFKCFSSGLNGEKGNIISEFNSSSYQIFFSPVYEKNVVSAVVMLLFDISEKSETEKIRREFTANVSHELKTPLTTIHGYAQIISKGFAKPENISEIGEKIEKESSRLITLIDDIMQLSRLDENDGNTLKNNVDLSEITGEVIDILKAKAKQRNINISYEFENCDILVNVSQITELVYNLVDNAIKYNVENGNVFVRVFDKILTVTDTGIGIAKESLPRIFERFFRVDKSHSKKVNGTGLGLSIVKHIASINNASIEVESKVNEGSTFKVIFK